MIFAEYQYLKKNYKLYQKTIQKIKLREEDLQKWIDKTESHYRKLSTDHKNEFYEDHYKLFYEATGKLITILGYEK